MFEKFVDYSLLLDRVRKTITDQYPNALSSENNREQVKSFVLRYLRANKLLVKGKTLDELADALCEDMLEKMVEYPVLLDRVRQHITERHPDMLNFKSNHDQVKPYVLHYLRSNKLLVRGMTVDQLADTLCSDLLEFSFLSLYMERDDVDEININAWDDVVVTYNSGETEKIQGFPSPEKAADMVKKMLEESHTTLDAAIPKAEGQLPNNGRITALLHPLVDQTTYVSASIRMLHPSRITTINLLDGGSASPEMLRFLTSCMRYGVSFVVAGATFSGKTTLLNALLKTMPDDKRIFTLESGARELDLVRRDRNTKKITNNVVHTLARPSEKKDQNITMEKLVVGSLRFNPDLIVVGEMRDEEAYAAIDASLTGHTLVSTIHSFAGEDAHMRLATLCQKRFPMPLEISLMQAAKAFPVVCFEQRLDDGSRKITNISECEVDSMGHRTYRTLYRYVVERNDIVDGKLVIRGHFETGEPMSNHLKERMMMFGIPSNLLNQLEGGT